MIVAGLLLLSAGTAGAAFAMGVGASYAELVAPLVAIGLGIALVLPNVASAALGSALPEHIGKASGANSTFRQLGAVFGIAIAVLVFDRAGSSASPEAVVDGARGTPRRGRRRRPRRGCRARDPRPRTQAARDRAAGSRRHGPLGPQLSSKRGSGTRLAQLASSRRTLPAATKRATTRRRQP